MESLLDDLNKIAKILLEGAVILCPTDTIWGLSCDAFNQEAVNRIYKIKKRDFDKPFILLVNSIDMLKKYIVDIHPRVETLLAYYNRPMSVIYEPNEQLPTFLYNHNNSIAIRVIKDPLISQLIEKTGRPIISTSANMQAEPSPQNFNHIDSKIIELVDYVFKSGRNYNNGTPSLLIKFNEEGELLFLR